ncbi:MAG: hypothetical protein WC222_05160 [Parachlamydiales bacterium]|jgi:hypothetical protein
MQKKFMLAFFTASILLFSTGYAFCQPRAKMIQPPAFTAKAAYVKPQDVDQAAWDAIEPYFLPPDNPLKKKLDRLFSTSRLTSSSKALKAAGFTPLEDKEQDLIVATHPELPGYLIKLYYDNHNVKDRPGMPGEGQYWINRILGVERVNNSIRKHNYENIFVVPDKWIYPLPNKPAPTCLNSAACFPKHFVLVSIELNLVSHKENEKLYKEISDPKILEALYTVMQESHLYDSVYIDNNIFTREGKIAFIDTEDFDRKPILFNEMTVYFNPDMQRYWLKLLQERGATIKAKTSNE